MNQFRISNELESNKKNYRFMSFPMLMTMIEMEKIPLRKVLLWEDTFEAPLKYIQTKKEADKRTDFNYFGCCWTKTCDSDALWRIYSANKLGVCIETSAYNLKLAMAQTTQPLKTDFFPVVYGNIDSLIKDEQKNATLFIKGYRFPYLFIKRTAFKHEQELRLVCEYNNAPIPDFIEIDRIKIHYLINKVIFDPRTPIWYFETMSKYLSNYGIECKVSDLYSRPYLR